MFEKTPDFLRKPEEHEEIIEPPVGTYFIHGVKTWSKENSLSIRSPEISVSVQEDGKTVPLRPYGYRLKVYKGAIKKHFIVTLRASTTVNSVRNLN